MTWRGTGAAGRGGGLRASRAPPDGTKGGDIRSAEEVKAAGRRKGGGGFWAGAQSGRPKAPMTVEKVIIRPLSGRARVFPRGPAKRSAAGRQHPDNRPPNRPTTYHNYNFFFFFLSLSLSIAATPSPVCRVPQPCVPRHPALCAAAFQLPPALCAASPSPVCRVNSSSNLILPVTFPA